MTEQEAYQEHIRYTHDTYYRIVIRHASFDAARMLAARWHSVPAVGDSQGHTCTGCVADSECDADREIGRASCRERV